MHVTTRGHAQGARRPGDPGRGEDEHQRRAPVPGVLARVARDASRSTTSWRTRPPPRYAAPSSGSGSETASRSQTGRRSPLSWSSRSSPRRWRGSQPKPRARRGHERVRTRWQTLREDGERRPVSGVPDAAAHTRSSSPSRRGPDWGTARTAVAAVFEMKGSTGSRSSRKNSL